MNTGSPGPEELRRWPDVLLGSPFYCEKNIGRVEYLLAPHMRDIGSP